MKVIRFKISVFCRFSFSNYEKFYVQMKIVKTHIINVFTRRKFVYESNFEKTKNLIKKGNIDMKMGPNAQLNRG